MDNLSQNDSEYSNTFKECFQNRKNLKETFNEANYDLLEFQGEFSINDLFLNENFGMKCAKLLVDQARHQYQLLTLVHHDSVSDDIEILLDEFSVDSAFLKYLLSNDVQVSDLKVPDEVEAIDVHIYFIGPLTSIKPINCKSLVNFVDKLLQLITEKLEIHQSDCELEHCSRCIPWEELQEELDDIDVNPRRLLEDFEYTSNRNDFSFTSALLENFGKPPENVKFKLRFTEEAAAATPHLQEEYISWKRFKKIVLRKYNYLQQYYVENLDSLKENQKPAVILYKDTNDSVRVKHCASIPEARREANLLEDILEAPFPVVLISKTDRDPNIKPKKRKVKKLNLSKVGREETPSLAGTLQTPAGREPYYETPSMLFYLDTGADCGSVGYNYDIIKHFISTVEMINNSLEPAILCKFNTAKIADEEVHIFDVDKDPNWNAIGLAELKNYIIYMDIRNKRVEIAQRDDVTVRESEETFEVTFRKTIVPNTFPTTITYVE